MLQIPSPLTQCVAHLEGKFWFQHELCIGRFVEVRALGEKEVIVSTLTRRRVRVDISNKHVVVFCLIVVLTCKGFVSSSNFCYKLTHATVKLVKQHSTCLSLLKKQMKMRWQQKQEATQANHYFQCYTLPREAILLLRRGLVLKLVLCVQNGWLIVDCFCLFQSYQVKCERYAKVSSILWPNVLGEWFSPNMLKQFNTFSSRSRFVEWAGVHRVVVVW